MGDVVSPAMLVSKVQICSREILDSIASDSVEETLYWLEREGAQISHPFTMKFQIPDFEIDPMLTFNPPLIAVCAYYGACKIMKFLLQSFRDVLHLVDDKGRYAQHFAARNGELEALEILEAASQSNSFFETEDGHNRTILHYAAEGDHIDIFHWVYHKYGDSLFDGKSGFGTPLHRACINKAMRCFEFLADLNIQVLAENPHTPKSLLPIDFNCVWMTRSPAMWLHMQKGMELIPIGQRAGLDLNCPNANGWSLIYYVIRTGTEDEIEYLIRNGAGVNVHCQNGWTPLHVAAQERKPEMCELLYRYHALPIARTSLGQTPFDMARGFNRHDREFRTAGVLRNIEVDWFARAMIHTVLQGTG